MRGSESLRRAFVMRQENWLELWEISTFHSKKWWKVPLSPEKQREKQTRATARKAKEEKSFKEVVNGDQVTGECKIDLDLVGIFWWSRFRSD